MTDNKPIAPLLQAVKDAAPIMMAYFPIAITFGVVAGSSGFSFGIAAFISIWVYAGAAQFMLVSLFAAGVSPFATAITVLLVNLRHFLYGATLGPAFSKWPEKLKWLSGFGLTDEVFAVASTRFLSQPPQPAYQLTFAAACYLSWVAGTLVGAGIGRVIPGSVSNLFTFALPALFLALLLSTQRSLAHLSAALAGGALAVAAQMLQLGNLGIVLGAVVGATLGMSLQSKLHLRKEPSLSGNG